jgi:hypothetical protein
MGETNGLSVCEGDQRMTDTELATVASVPKLSARRTRVKLRRVNCDFSKPYPPDGGEKHWWDRLKAALGTTSSDFVNATLLQIQNASRMPSGGISETSVNAVLAFIEAAEPKNEIEAALAIQMACTARRHDGGLEQGWGRLWRRPAHSGVSWGSATECVYRPD